MHKADEVSSVTFSPSLNSPLSYIVSDQKVEFKKAGYFRHGGSELRVAW
jgi:hypothetical protein